MLIYQAEVRYHPVNPFLFTHAVLMERNMLKNAKSKIRYL